MNTSASPLSRPGRILLATDLGVRCDRALDRAGQLARQWQAPLLVVHAREPGTDHWPATGDVPSWRRPPDTAMAIERQIRRDLRHEVADLAIRVADGAAADVILEATRSEGCDLIVLGTASDSPSHHLLGSTIEQLVRKSPASVLIVKKRPHNAYRHVLVGTDFTVESRHGLNAATRWFPDATFALMHALDIPYKSLWLDGARSEAFARMEMATIDAFLADAGLPDEIRQRIQPLVEHGHPEVMLRDYVLERDADLTVIGALSRGLAFHMLVGGTARRIALAVPSDILVVRAPVA